MRFDVLSLFPQICEGVFEHSILKKAQENRLVAIRCLNIRDWTSDKHHITDEPPYGGGPGMVMKAEPIFAAVEAIRSEQSRIILLTPSGHVFSHQVARRLSSEKHLVFICGHYEGVDHRVAQYLADEEISIGDYIVSNGAIAATVIIDAVARLIPGVLGDSESAEEESFAQGLLEYPQYTRPSIFRGWKVPEILLSGDHTAIRCWRMMKAREKTNERRPDLLKDS
ncbi:MAG: tRNA (guanosine(37)-N1)-methyltransferase TrmD [Verrucomicrobia bacterium]|nr:tRNA (guanosine(37)-N1)-methyltransferase TrmD [Verrucomicrobiota bacterium]MBV9673032.1 tRNA (guanosine(37)-N1)-methyltransferase TrmD [Verrucomicrobiota bacterium]